MKIIKNTWTRNGSVKRESKDEEKRFLSLGVWVDEFWKKEIAWMSSELLAIFVVAEDSILSRH